MQRLSADQVEGLSVTGPDDAEVSGVQGGQRGDATVLGDADVDQAEAEAGVLLDELGAAGVVGEGKIDYLQGASDPRTPDGSSVSAADSSTPVSQSKVIRASAVVDGGPGGEVAASLTDVQRFAAT